MKLCVSGCLRGVLVFLLLFAANSNAKSIRLRNEIIDTTPAPATQAQQQRVTQNQATNGLFLVQFSSPPTAEFRAQLEQLGILFVQYVPDDAYVVRLDRVSPGAVRQLPNVNWVGKYLPSHKVHQGLAEAGRKAKTGLNPEKLNVSVLTLPRMQGQEIASVRRLLSLQKESTLQAGTILRGTVTSAQLQALAESELVVWIEPDRPMKMFDEVASKLVAGDGGTHTLLTQSLGYDGAGVTVAVADSGLNNGDAASMHPDLLGRTPAFFFYGDLTSAADEHSHGTHVAGIIAGNGATGETDENNNLYGLGVAPAANIVGQRIFDADGGYHPPSDGFGHMTRDALGAGAVIGSNSWGDDTQGRYDNSALEFDELVRDADPAPGQAGDQPYILEFSAGNAGPAAQTIGSPAVAKNVIATGASENDRLDFVLYGDGIDAMADFSSRGPCEDGRIKPDIVAPGTWISSLQSASATDQYAWSPISANYQYQGGTSQAGPHASGAAAVFVQYYKQHHTNAVPSPALVKAALINSAIDMDDSFGTGPVPNMDEGWGRIDLTGLVDPALTSDLVDQTVILTNSQVYERFFTVSQRDEPLRITLAYTDYPGFPGSIPALVNDLDLELVAPDGTRYAGNQMEGGESMPYPVASDALNNVEGIRLASPLPGEYLLRVRARKVVQDSRKDTTAVDQDFALVISALFPGKGEGIIGLDRGAYRAPDKIQIFVVDSDLAGTPTINVRVASTTEATGELITLNASNSRGSFTGQVATATGPRANDGILQVADKDAITVTYSDASPSANRVAQARADLVAPIISGVVATNQFSLNLFVWNTDEPATSILRYGPDATHLTSSITNLQLVTEHSISLPVLNPGQTYFFQVSSSDEAGNSRSNSVGSFVATRPKTLLLVDAFVSDFADNDIPLSVYTDPLDQLGISYDIWSPEQVGRSPGTNDFKPYRAIIWRLNDGVFSADTLSATDQNSIRRYLDQGGAFFMASMEQLTRLGQSAFRKEVLHVSDIAEDVQVPSADGVGGDPITGGMSLNLDYSQYGNNLWHDLLGVPDDISDTMTLLADADPIFYEPSSGNAAGMKYPKTGHNSNGRVVFFSFPLDAVSETDSAPNNRVTLVQNIMSFLVPGLNGRGSVALDSPAYTLPAVVTIEVADSDLAGQASASAKASTTSDSAGVSVTLIETPVPGLFRGTVQLVSTTTQSAQGQLRGKNGDQLFVDYVDVSRSATVRASAQVDTVAPDISGVNSFPDYQEAEITWTTTEPSDSLVQFGSSRFLDRAASTPALVTEHSISIKGLAPEQQYFFQVVSRDAAGNTRVADNGGNYYPFTTLAPLHPDWTDTLETGGTNWSVYSGDGSQTEWTLGTPDNGVTTNAYSGTNVWGSNLGGGVIDSDDIYLISPAIFLTGGTSAWLRFQHNYDFSTVGDFDIFEYGQVMILTNTIAEPIPLVAYEDSATDGWEEEEIDVSAYIGQVVYFTWNYALFSFDGRPRPGWLVDDISVTVSNSPFATLIISNNIAQAVTYLSGSAMRTNYGLLTILTNMPTGPYTLSYGDVPYYLKPSSQSTNLSTGGSSVLLSGVYTFPDSNQNGMSDLWEQAQFQSVSPSRTSSTDTDGDSMTDYAEFVAGTDPKNPASELQVSEHVTTGGGIQLNWQALPGRSYLVEGSTNTVSWTPLSSWSPPQNTSQTMSFSLPGPNAGSPYLFRVRVHQ